MTGKIKQKEFYTDEPIKNKSDDIFERNSFAKRIAEVILQRQETRCFTVGVYGAWGDGKTSTLRLIEITLNKEGKDDTIVVRFNPWRISSEEGLLSGFFQTLASALGKKLHTIKERIFKTIADYGEAVSSVTFPSKTVSGAAGGIVQLMKGQAKVTLETLKNRVEKILIEEGKRVVVIIDDIDRLSILR